MVTSDIELIIIGSGIHLFSKNEASKKSMLKIKIQH